MSRLFSTPRGAADGEPGIDAHGVLVEVDIVDVRAPGIAAVIVVEEGGAGTHGDRVVLEAPHGEQLVPGLQVHIHAVRDSARREARAAIGIGRIVLIGHVIALHDHALHAARVGRVVLRQAGEREKGSDREEGKACHDAFAVRRAKLSGVPAAIHQRRMAFAFRRR